MGTHVHTVRISFPQRTLPSWRGILCVDFVASWTIALAFWLVQSFWVFCWKKIDSRVTNTFFFFLNPFQALNFQGRLKYLHGQKVLRDNGTCSHPQLALFTIAVPVQPPPILEIRAKMLLFQSKHKLDFTPLFLDSR